MSEPNEPTEPHGPRLPWFAERPGTVLLYRVNRRPLPQPTLLGEQPASVMDHIAQLPLFGKHVVTGRGDRRRDWILGNRLIRSNETGLTGQIGWQQADEQQTSRYSPDTQEWQDEVEPTERATRAPFAFDARSRILGVLKHRSFGERVIAEVFQTLLRECENAREWPSTEWSVEAILDERDFLNWLATVQSVTSITLVAKLPNPDGLQEFGPVWEQMQAREARLISMQMICANDDTGLQGLLDDERVQGGLAMGQQGFGHVKADGLANGNKRVFDQREKVARRVLDEVGPTWPDATTAVLDATRESADDVLRRRTSTTPEATPNDPAT